MKKIFTLLGFLSIGTAVFSQCDKVLVSGYVKDTMRQETFYNMMIVNRSTGKGVFGQPNGYYSTYASEGDMMTISVKGYELIHFKVTSDENCQVKRTFIIEGKPYEFEAFVVRPLKSLEQIREEREALAMRDTRTVSGVDVLQSPITALYQAFNRQEKHKRKIEEMKFQDSQRNVVKELLRLYVAYDIVDLNDEDFDHFIDFLNVNVDFLKTASEFELVEFIKGKYEHFMYVKAQKGSAIIDRKE